VGAAATVGTKSAAHLPTTATAYEAAIATVAGSTGQLLILTMLIMYTAAMETMRVCPSKRERVCVCMCVRVRERARLRRLICTLRAPCPSHAPLTHGSAVRKLTRLSIYLSICLSVCLCLACMPVGVGARRQRKYFETFWYSHHLFILFFILLIAHGAGCLIQPNVAVRSPEPRTTRTCTHTRTCMHAKTHRRTGI
jgi:hypothetical protein